MGYTNALMSKPSSSPPLDIWPGQPHPFGAHWDGQGVNFALYSRHATRVELVLLDSVTHQPLYTLHLPEKTGPVWHGYVAGLRPGQVYGYRVHGSFDPGYGYRFNANKLLLDPYARALARMPEWHPALFGYTHRNDLTASLQDSAPYAPLGMVTDDSFDWQGDKSPNIPLVDTIIYETHVKGISKLHPEVPEALRGTYLGLCSEPIIRHLKALGVTAVQLLPIHAKLTDNHLAERNLSNYWGYNTLSYFAAEPSYATAPQQALTECKTMIRELHKAGLEVIIDVVYNHTGEGNHLGPTVSWRGIDNAAYYKLNPERPRYYMDYTGTGNTLDPGNPYVLQLIMDSLRYWVVEMHVDGFRFDLASALAREFFDVDMLSAFFKVIQQDPVLSRVKLIAEPWDVGHGGYQIGNFPWYWAEWNGRYRDAMRSFWRGDPQQVGELATRLAGSSDLYALSGRKPFASINFIAAHDGYTLHDLVSYTKKHNFANGEGNRDGHNHNLSINFGVEGETDDATIIRQRNTLKRSFVATLMLSQGVPMLLGGDELGRTQGGNNNAYCQDNAISWYDWALTEDQQTGLEFVKRIIAFRKAHPIFRRRNFLTGQQNSNFCRDVSWWHPDGYEMTEDDWHDDTLHSLGMLLCGAAYYEVSRHGETLGDDTFLILMASRLEMSFILPLCPDGNGWQLCWGTGDDTPRAGTRYLEGDSVTVDSYALLVLTGV